MKIELTFVPSFSKCSVTVKPACNYYPAFSTFSPKKSETHGGLENKHIPQLSARWSITSYHLFLMSANARMPTVPVVASFLLHKLKP